MGLTLGAIVSLEAHADAIFVIAKPTTRAVTTKVVALSKKYVGA
jgi:hypothetical protein